MWPHIPSTRQIWDTRLTSKSGLVSNAPSGGTVDSPLIELLVAILLGALAGLVIGFIISGVLRYFSIILGRHIGGAAWTLYASLAGAVVFAILAVARDE